MRFRAAVPHLVFEFRRARARSTALKEADVALVIGVPMDFRLGFGGAFGEETELIERNSLGDMGLTIRHHLCLLPDAREPPKG